MIGTVVPVVGLRQYAHSLKLRLTYAWGSHLRAAAHPVKANDAVRACSRSLKTASTELSERVKDKAAGQKEQARGGQRPRARAWQTAALITNSRCKMCASPSRAARGIGHHNPALKESYANSRVGIPHKPRRLLPADVNSSRCHSAIFPPWHHDDRSTSRCKTEVRQPCMPLAPPAKCSSVAVAAPSYPVTTSNSEFRLAACRFPSNMFKPIVHLFRMSRRDLWGGYRRQIWH